MVDSKFLLQAVGSAGFFAFAAVQSKLFKNFSLNSDSRLRINCFKKRSLALLLPFSKAYLPILALSDGMYVEYEPLCLLFLLRFRTASSATWEMHSSYSALPSSELSNEGI